MHSGGKTNADTLVWRVVFSEAVSNVDRTDFTVGGTGIGSPTVAVAAVSDTGDTTWDVTASGGNLANLNATVTLDFDTAQDIRDGVGNALTTTLPNGAANTYEVDNTAPTVGISTDVSGATTSGPFTATFTFSEPVKGFVVGDVTVGNGAASAFTEDTAGRVWTATVTPEVNGTAVTLDVAANVATDDAGNGNEAASSVSLAYTRTLAAPATFTATGGDGQVTLNWGAPADSGGTAALSKYQYRYGSGSTVTWGSWADVADSDDDSDVTDETSATISSLTNGTAYSFQVRAVNSAGDGAAASATATPNETTAPTVTAITRRSMHSGGKTNADTLVWRVVFSEAVVNVDQTDFTVGGTGIGSVTKTVTAVANSGGTTYDVTASDGNLANLDATVTLDFDTAQDIRDGVGNALTTTLPNGAANTYEVDNTAPTITTDFPSNWGDGSRTITITFSEVVTGFTYADVTVTGATSSSFTAGTPAGESWTIEIGSATSNGTPVTLEIAANGASDAAGNSNAAFSISADYTRTLEAPATFTATAGDTQVTLNWSAPSDSGGTAALTKYQYRYKVSSASNWGGWTDVADSDGDNDVTDETSATISSLTNGTAYSFQVRAVNSAGDGAAASATATPAAATNAVVVSLNRVGGGAVTEGHGGVHRHPGPCAGGGRDH